MNTRARPALHGLLVSLVCLLPFQAAATPPPPAADPSAALVAPAAGLTAIYNTNLIPDGDAEAPSANYWVDGEGFSQVVPYGAGCGGMCNFPSPYDVGPTQRGNGFFYMGTTSNHSNGTNLWLKNHIALAAIQAAVDAGRIRYRLSGYFGGDTLQTDTAQLHLFFEPGSGPNIGEVVVGNVTPADRQNKTGLLYREATGTVPPGTRSINLVLQTGAMSGSDWRTGYADNLSLVLSPVQNYLPAVANGLGANQPPAQTGYPAPSGVVALADGLTRMGIYWTDHTNDELGFEVQRINADSSVDTICNTKPNVTWCLDPGLSQSGPYGYKYLGSHTTYLYQVRAVGPGLNSAWAIAYGTTATQPLSPPSPTHGAFTCQALEVTASSATFVWNDPFNYEAGFNLYLGANVYASYTVMERGAKITFINLAVSSLTLKIVPFVYDRTNPLYVYESSTACSATAHLPAPPASGSAYFHNDASYPVISLMIDGWEQFPVRPLAILPGAYYALEGVPAGAHQWTAITGFWDDYGQRFEMYDYAGQFTQPASASASVHVSDMTIQDLLSVPPANQGYWEGYYFDAYGNCFTTAFKFRPNGTFSFYNANQPNDSGTYTLVQREPAIFSTKFHVSGAHQNVDGLLVETHGQFFMKNGPPSWQQITYVYKPQGYVRNPFCP